MVVLAFIKLSSQCLWWDTGEGLCLCYCMVTLSVHKVWDLWGACHTLQPAGEICLLPKEEKRCEADHAPLDSCYHSNIPPEMGESTIRPAVWGHNVPEDKALWG